MTGDISWFACVLGCELPPLRYSGRSMLASGLRLSGHSQPVEKVENNQVGQITLELI